jgi:hypothetical protein
LAPECHASGAGCATFQLDLAVIEIAAVRDGIVIGMKRLAAGKDNGSLTSSLGNCPDYVQQLFSGHSGSLVMLGRLSHLPATE